MRVLPNLNLPDDQSNMSSHGSTGSGDSAQTSVRFKTSYSAAQLISFFDEQISNQDWQHEASWKGSIGEGSIWSTRQESQGYTGSLQVTIHSDSEFTARFTLAITD